MKLFALVPVLMILLLYSEGARAQQPDSSSIADTPLSKRVIELEQVEVSTEMAKFQNDSAWNSIVYKKAIGDAARKPDLKIIGPGLMVSGVVSELAMKVSGKKKKLKKFAARLEADTRQQYTETRYNAGVVSRVTGIGMEAATAFVNSHPIPYDFVRAASDLEIKAWIREEYKKSGKD